jgi:hypothetical protein
MAVVSGYLFESVLNIYKVALVMSGQTEMRSGFEAARNWVPKVDKFGSYRGPEIDQASRGYWGRRLYEFNLKLFNQAKRAG